MTNMDNSATIRIAMGEAMKPHRIMINHSDISQEDWDTGRSMAYNGWTHKMEFWAYPKRHPRTIRIAVGEAMKPHRIMVNQAGISQEDWDTGRSMAIQGWEHKMEFWAYPKRQPGTIRIAVGEAMTPHRIMVNQASISQEDWDTGRSMTIQGWEHKMEFWVYPSKPTPKATSTKPISTTKTIFIGNPGTGKSTLLNGLLGKAAFESGISSGQGLTTVLQWEETSNGDSYADTPGLSDVKLSEQAALEITKALKSGDGHYKLVFVMKDDEGRIRPDDLVTMNLVLDALQNIDADVQYAIIVNKVETGVLEKLRVDRDACTQFLSALGGKYSTPYVHLYERVETLVSKSNGVHEVTDDLRSFLLTLPSIYIKQSHVMDVSTGDLELKIREMKEELSKVHGDKKAQEERLKEMEKLSEIRINQLKKDSQDLAKKLEKDSRNQITKLEKKSQGQMKEIEKKYQDQIKKVEAGNKRQGLDLLDILKIAVPIVNLF